MFDFHNEITTQDWKWYEPRIPEGPNAEGFWLTANHGDDLMWLNKEVVEKLPKHIMDDFVRSIMTYYNSKKGLQ